MRVDWVHPSWRDLIIESLAADDVERRRFLARCGVDGAALAVSWGGGASGERERPLLRGDADWDALGDGLHHLGRELDEEGAIQLLAVLDDAGAFDEVLALARLVLDRLGWAGKAISVDAIGAWSRLAVKLHPRPEPPAVALTWLELEPSRVPRTPAELERFADWIRLASILHEHDFELLERLGFPRDYAGLLRDFADQQPRDEPPVERDLRLETLDRIAGMDPVDASRAIVTASELRVQEEPALWTVADVEPVEGFPVERVLRDLV